MSSKLFLYIYIGGIALRPLIRLPAFIKRSRGAIKEGRADLRERLYGSNWFKRLLTLLRPERPTHMGLASGCRVKHLK